MWRICTRSIPDCRTRSIPTAGLRAAWLKGRRTFEGLPYYGPILVPLDGDISNATSEVPSFPFGSGDRGTYHYEASALVATLQAAIGEPLDLAARHVVVHGVDLATPLPATVQSLPGLPAQVTLPLACGEIREVQ